MEENCRRIEKAHAFYHFYAICRHGSEQVHPEVEITNHISGESPASVVITMSSNALKASFDMQPDLCNK